jgi:hypothetical protein
VERPAGQPLRTLTTWQTTAVLPPAGTFVAELRGDGSLQRQSPPRWPQSPPPGNRHCLVIPYRCDGRARPTSEPLHTLSTKDSAGLLQPACPHRKADDIRARWRWRTATSRWSPRESSSTANASTLPTSSTATKANKPCKPETPSASTRCPVDRPPDHGRTRQHASRGMRG